MVRDKDGAQMIDENRQILEDRNTPVQVIKVRARARGCAWRGGSFRSCGYARTPNRHARTLPAPQAYPRQVYPLYFADRFPLYIDPGAWWRRWRAEQGMGKLARHALVDRAGPGHAAQANTHHADTIRCAELSSKIFDGLVAIEMIDGDGNVLEDPRWVGWWCHHRGEGSSAPPQPVPVMRAALMPTCQRPPTPLARRRSYTERPWLTELQDEVPAVKGQTEDFEGHTVPRFPEMSEDVTLPGVRGA